MTTQQPTNIHRIVFCFPGSSFSSAFLTSWSNILLKLTSMGHQVLMANRDESPWFVRNLCLGGNVLRGKEQKPFNGQVEYDYLFFINHDIVFSVNDILALIADLKDSDRRVVGGVVPISGEEYDIIDKGHWSFQEYIQMGRFRPFTRGDLVLKQDAVFEVDHVSAGFVCMRQGVIEELEYPWFKPLYFEFSVDVEDGSGNTSKRDIRDYCSDDIGFSRSLAEKGISMWVNPLVTVGREHSQLTNFPHRQFIEEQKKQGTYEKTIADVSASVSKAMNRVEG